MYNVHHNILLITLWSFNNLECSISLFILSGHLVWPAGRYSHVEESPILVFLPCLYWGYSAMATDWTNPTMPSAQMKCKWTMQIHCKKLSYIESCSYYINCLYGYDDVMWGCTPSTTSRFHQSCQGALWLTGLWCNVFETRVTFS